MRKWIMIICCLISVKLNAQYVLTGSYSQDFTALGLTDLSDIPGGDLGAINSALTGWYFKETGTGANTTITASDGTNLQGDTYNFGAGQSPDRALGGIQSGMLLPVVGCYFINGTGQVISSMSITYTGEQWRLGSSGRTDRLDFQYSQNATLPDNGYWLDVNVLDFYAPVNSGMAGALDGNLPGNRIQYSYTISGLHIPDGSTFFIRWIDFNATGSDDGLAIDDISIVPGFIPAAQGYFRSVASGEWTDPGTWEYSADNVVWEPSSFVPNAAAGAITIRNSHTVTFKGFLPIDDVQIENGGVIDFRNGIIAINDGMGGGVSVQGGGMMVLQAASNPPVFASAAAHIDIHSGGILRVAAGGLTNSPGGGVHADNFIYRHQSVLEFDLPTAFGSVGVTYFPNADATTVPIFRVKQNIGVSVGSVSNTTFNGVFEALGNITFANSGHKIFRNGIRGTGNINGATSGKFIINGGTAELGGSGSLIVPNSGGLEIGSADGTTVDLTSDKMITGNISFANSPVGNYVDLHQHQLIVTGNISGASENCYVRTIQEGGILTLNNTGVDGKIFPVGETSFNPVTISTTSGSAAISAAVRSGIFDPSGPVPADAVMRTWYLQSAAPVTAEVSFQYAATAGELAGSAAAQPTTMELLQSDLVTWHVVPGNAALTALPVPGPPYQVTTSNPVALGSNPIPFALAKAGTVILPVEFFVSNFVESVHGKARVHFEISEHDEVSEFVIERTSNKVRFDSIGNLVAISGRVKYYYDDQPADNGINYYRVKAIMHNGDFHYSGVMKCDKAFSNKPQLFVRPIPAKGQIEYEIQSAQSGIASVFVFSVDGRMLNKSLVRISRGKTENRLFVPYLSTGKYILAVQLGQEKASASFMLIN